MDAYPPAVNGGAADAQQSHTTTNGTGDTPGTAGDGANGAPVTPPPANESPSSTAKTKPEWRNVSDDDPCLFCGATSDCKIRVNDSEAACRNRDTGTEPYAASNGLKYWVFNSRDIRQEREERRVNELRRLIELLHPPGDDRLFEVRVLNIRPERGKPYNAAGYFTDAAKAARAALKYERMQSEGVYITVNPPDPLCHARAPDKIKDYQDTTTSDVDILRREWLVIDCDPKRPKGVCATAEMVEAAKAFAARVKTMLTERYGWPEPVEALSGNGQYLLYRIDLPNDEEAKHLIENALKAINAMMDGGAGDHE